MVLIPFGVLILKMILCFAQNGLFSLLLSHYCYLNTPSVWTGGSIFDDGSTSGSGGPKRTAKVSLLTEDDLFLTGDTQTTTSKEEKSIFEAEDNSDILE